jgi:hypothetical protein
VKNAPSIITIDYSGMGKVLQVSYYIQGTYVGSTHEYPFSFTFVPQREGLTVIRALAESTLGKKEALTTIVVDHLQDNQQIVLEQ